MGVDREFWEWIRSCGIRSRSGTDGVCLCRCSGSRRTEMMAQSPRWKRRKQLNPRRKSGKNSTAHCPELCSKCRGLKKVWSGTRSSACGSPRVRETALSLFDSVRSSRFFFLLSVAKTIKQTNKNYLFSRVFTAGLINDL